MKHVLLTAFIVVGLIGCGDDIEKHQDTTYEPTAAELNASRSSNGTEQHVCADNLRADSLSPAGYWVDGADGPEWVTACVLRVYEDSFYTCAHARCGGL